MDNKSALITLLSPNDYFALVRAIELAVMQSVKAFPLRIGMKDTEVRRRAQWCVDVAVTLRRDLQWSGERIADHMIPALHTYLKTGAWEPSQDQTHRIWRT